MNPIFVKFNKEDNNGEVTININHITHFHTAQGRSNDATMILLSNGNGVVVAETYGQVEHLLDLVEKGELDFKGMHK